MLCYKVTLRYIALRYATLPHATLQGYSVKLHHTPLQCYTALHYLTLHYIMLWYSVTSHYITSCYITLPSITFWYISVSVCVECVRVSACVFVKKDPSGGAACLTDGDTETYWESDGMQGQHWIRLHMKRGTVVRYARAHTHTHSRTGACHFVFPT